MTANEIIIELQSSADEKNKAGMKRFAVGNDTALGIKLPVLREMAKHLKNNHELAIELWNTGIHEAMLIASMIADPKKITKQQMDTWTHQFYSWDICDQCCMNLFHKADFALEKAFEYTHAKEEFVKRAGFAIMVSYSVHHKKAPDEMCLIFLPRLEAEAWDDRNFVKKAINWCLRQIGKRSAFLHPYALACAYRIDEQPYRSAHWIAKDAIRELNSEAVLKRLKIQ